MFEPDLFSDRMPMFQEATAATAGAVADVLRRHFAELGLAPARVRQSGAVELNSNNFLVEMNGNRYIVKRWPAGTNGEKAVRNRQANLANWLAEQGVRIATIRRSHSTGDCIVEHADRCWCVLDYVEGEYFSGDGTEFLDTGRALQRLFEGLQRAPAHLSIERAIAPPSAQSTDLLAAIERERDRWPEIFGAHAGLLSESWVFIRAEHVAVVGIQAELEASIGLCHIDLHPHNVLMSNGMTAAVLDFASLLKAPVASIISFNLFKLARQAIAARRDRSSAEDVGAQRDAIVGALERSGLIDAGMRHRLSLLAKAEIMRRLLYILNLNHVSKNPQWNHVLPVQINALREADAVFPVPAEPRYLHA